MVATGIRSSRYKSGASRARGACQPDPVELSDFIPVAGSGGFEGERLGSIDPQAFDALPFPRLELLCFALRRAASRARKSLASIAEVIAVDRLPGLL